MNWLSIGKILEDAWYGEVGQEIARQWKVAAEKGVVSQEKYLQVKEGVKRPRQKAASS